MVGSDALQAIVYARGSLRLLDQVRLLIFSFPFLCFASSGHGVLVELGLIDFPEKRTGFSWVLILGWFCFDAEEAAARGGLHRH